MIPASFRYAAPQSVGEAVDLLAAHADAKVLAGGHSLLPLMKLRLAMPPVLVDINRIPGLDYIREDPQIEQLRVGALARHIDFERSQLIQDRYPLLWDAARGIGDPLVRNRGTLAGAVAHADPAADWPAALLAANASVVATSPRGERIIPLSEFFRAILTTALTPDELVTELRIPFPEPRSGGAYEKLERKVGDYAVIGVGVQLSLNAAGTIAKAGIGLCNAGSTSIRATEAAAYLVGKPPATDYINEAAQLAMQASDPIEDDRGPVDYKRAMVRELTRRALRRALARAEGGRP
ncbi:MAG: xanthine dehydrogenase family protein subunit M [Chloroflexi bacterium]|nr:xanthine dehydrogenase family protein subunit M [Chloroflexota bacterium]MBV9133464.1 xanthine dehydrogenase family protein subunit M [Chloroflexota bacterium]MBV9894992.1 xanthine dehydrogenase family protein subunit M [Chloroflexota bacterium]